MKYTPGISSAFEHAQRCADAAPMLFDVLDAEGCWSISEVEHAARVSGLVGASALPAGGDTPSFVCANSLATAQNRQECAEKKEKRPKHEQMITDEILAGKLCVAEDDIAGLGDLKKALTETIIWPLKRPSLFHGLRGPVKGFLLFGPPGTGKTLVGKFVASQSSSTFFNISSSSLTSKWIGEGEKLVRALFKVAREMQPSVIFIDEIDSILCKRTDGENEASRRIKTEFLVQFDGTTASPDDRILVIGATNRPQELDDAARRRFAKRFYVALPVAEARVCLIRRLLRDDAHSIDDAGFARLAELTDGYSGSDIFALCREAAMEPLRDATAAGEISMLSQSDLRPIALEDFENGLLAIRRSVSPDDLLSFETWNTEFGTYPRGTR